MRRTDEDIHLSYQKSFAKELSANFCCNKQVGEGKVHNKKLFQFGMTLTIKLIPGFQLTNTGFKDIPKNSILAIQKFINSISSNCTVLDIFFLGFI